jgi:hypothetical protein
MQDLPQPLPADPYRPFQAGPGHSDFTGRTSGQARRWVKVVGRLPGGRSGLFLGLGRPGPRPAR